MRCVGECLNAGLVLLNRVKSVHSKKIEIVNSAAGSVSWRVEFCQETPESLCRAVDYNAQPRLLAIYDTK